MKVSTLVLLIGATAAKRDSKLDGSLSSVPIASLAAKSHGSLSQLNRDEEDTGYANEDTVDTADYVTGAPINPSALIQLNKNDKLDGTLSVVQIQAPHHEKMVRLHDDDEDATGYANHETVDVSDYVTGAPANLVQLRKSDTDGTLSIV
jgi:hypothetical protein